MRNFGVEQALRVARHAAEHPHPYVVGFSMAGDEAGFPAGDFAEVFRIVADAGLGCTIHAGEWAGPDSVRAALELPVTRISHGVRAIEDPALVDELAARGIVLECCPTSNVVLGVYPSYEEHPLPALRDAGVKVTLGSDDPPYFGATIDGEYEVCADRMGFSDDDLREITRTAIAAAFCDEDLRGVLSGRLHCVGAHVGDAPPAAARPRSGSSARTGSARPTAARRVSCPLPGAGGDWRCSRLTPSELTVTA